MATYQLSNTDLYLHQARMLHIKGNVEQSLALYKHILQGMLQNSKQYPQYEAYYKSYINLILEEAEAIKEVEYKKSQPKEPIHFYLPSDEEPTETVSYSPSTTYSNPPPLPTQPKPTYGNTQPSDPSSLTKSDLQYVAAGVINGLQNFDREYNVSDKCKQAYSACSNKAKEINEKYELSKKAQELGHQIKEWDERNGVSQAVVNGIMKAAKSVEGAVKDYADKSRNNPEIARNVHQPY